MRQQIFTQNAPSPLEAAARDILATVDYIVRQAAIRGNQLDASQLTMLSNSANTMRWELRATARVSALSELAKSEMS